MAHEQHTIKDVDNYFVINPITREITNESGKTVLMQHDHNSEILTFKVPENIESHLMGLCTGVQIHFKNIELSSGVEFEDVYDVDMDNNFTINSSEGFCLFSWLISGNATQYVGALEFSVRFVCTDEDGIIDYVWNTAIHRGLVISPSFYNSEAVVAAYSDVLEKWRTDLYLASIGEGVSVSEVRSMLGAVAVDGKTAILPVANWVNGAQTVEVDGVTADPETCHVFTTYQPGSYEQYRDSYIRCTAQGAGTLTFACDSDAVPTADVGINVAIYYTK